MKSFKKILIINLGGIGDILLSTPALKALKSAFPGNRICLLVFPHVAELAATLPYLDRIFCLYKGIRNIPGNLNTLFKLRMEKFDTAVNMRTLFSETGAKKIKFLLNFINPALSAGRNTDGKGDFLDIKIPETSIAEKPDLEYDIDMVKALGADVVDRRISFAVNDENSKRVDSVLRERGIKKRDVLIGIHPGGKPANRWPLDNFSKVIDRVYKEMPCKFVITGGKNELNITKRLARITAAETINLAGRFGTMELGAVIRRCNLFISNDTGVMHIAAALKVSLVAIFGPGDIIRYTPRGIPRRIAVLYKKFPCSPCHRMTCGSMKCLKAISPEEVIDASLGLLKKETSE